MRSLPQSFCRCRLSLNNKPSLEIPEVFGRRFSLDEIKKATNNFESSFLMRIDGHGSTYKGSINGGVTVAIKRTSAERGWGIDTFKNEVLLLSQLCHPHLVSLIGICNDKDEMITVYEYMDNRSLDDHLHLNSGRLTWKQRLKICIGVASGIHYLHTGGKRGIIHGDLQTRNIQLDVDFTPKVSDFSLGKIGAPSISKTDLTRTESVIRGTSGYMAPEYAFYGIKTEKLDVFSFGIILLEVVIARNVNRESQDMPDCFPPDIDEGKIEQIIDPSLKGKISPESLQVFLKVARDCLHAEGIQRPPMGEVEVQLDLALQLQERAEATTKGINSP